MSLNILVVDDSSIVRAMIIKTLQVAEMPVGEIHEAGNGQEGLNLLDTHWIDLVFADINMPVMNGEEMIGAIRSNPVWQDLPIMAISTEGSETRINRLKAMNVCFIHKPFTPEQIRNAVNNLLEMGIEGTTV